MDAPRPADRSADDVDEAVFDVVETIPPGRVSTYGAIGRLVGVGPRRVARRSPTSLLPRTAIARTPLRRSYRAADHRA